MTFAAAWEGHEACLRAAVELGAPWHPETLAAAHESGNAATIACAELYAKQAGC